MTEKTRKIVVLSALPAALIWAAFNLDFGGDEPAAPSAEYATIQPVQPVPGTIAAAPNPKLIDIEQFQDVPWGQDPFRCYRYGGGPEQEPSNSLAWILGGIIYSADNPMAFVNRRPVKIGDLVDGATVVAIDNQVVTLEYQGKTISLKVNEG
jgi:hypothetical protein